MNKLKKVFQCIKYRRIILGEVGKYNSFQKGTRIESTSIIGNNNYFSFRVMVGNAKIGNYCSFGPDVKIGQSVHSIDFYTTCQKISGKCISHKLVKEQTIIGNDVWIGANAVVVQGVKIGNGVVIGANAVVTTDIPDYGIAAGVPAKVIRFRLDEITREELLKSEWWNLKPNDVCALFCNMINKK